MASLQVNLELLRQYEAALDPRFPEQCVIPAKVLGYGEISTVLEIGMEGETDLAYKRMSLFRTEQEAERYKALYWQYVQVLQDRIGIKMVPSDIVQIADEQTGRIVVYIVQKRLPSEAIGHKAIHSLSPPDINKLIRAVLRETVKVFDFNRLHKGELEVGFDGQISNWAIVNLSPDAAGLDDEIELDYFDTSSPMLRQDGVEQLDAELFLRSAPSFLVWVLRLLFLEDVMTRYYDLRKVLVDLVANFYKEQRPELVPELVGTINEFLSTAIQSADLAPITVDEVRAYYREDAWIWRLYLAFRKVDRSLHRLLRRDYPYILPGKTKR